MSITNLVKQMHTKFKITSEEVPFSEEEKKTHENVFTTKINEFYKGQGIFIKAFELDYSKSYLLNIPVDFIEYDIL